MSLGNDYSCEFEVLYGLFLVLCHLCKCLSDLRKLHVDDVLVLACGNAISIAENIMGHLLCKTHHVSRMRVRRFESSRMTLPKFFSECLNTTLCDKPLGLLAATPSHLCIDHHRFPWTQPRLQWIDFLVRHWTQDLLHLHGV